MRQSRIKPAFSRRRRLLLGLLVLISLSGCAATNECKQSAIAKPIKLPPSVSAVGEESQNANSSTESVIRQASHSERVSMQAPLPSDTQDSDALMNSQDEETQVANEGAGDVGTESSTLGSLSSSVSSQEPVEYFV